MIMNISAVYYIQTGWDPAPTYPFLGLLGHDIPILTLFPTPLQAGHEIILLCESDPGARQVH
jgi:hypothetical protein